MKRHRAADSEAQAPARRSKRLLKKAIRSATSASLCDYCASIQLPRGGDKSLLAARDVYSRRLADVLAAARSENSCALCSFLTDRIQFSAEITEKHSDRTVSLRVTHHAEDYAASASTQLEFRLNNNETPFRYDICKYPRGVTQDPGNFDGKYSEPHPDIHDGRMRYHPRLVHHDPFSEAAVGLVKDWLSQCRSHDTCKVQEPRPLPTRVIDVSTDKLLIVETDGSPGFYVALSHCWGSISDTFSTNAQNIEERKTKGLVLSEMPANFRHAIAFTQLLGYKYVWIDSLCIIQKDVLDWRHEAGRMAAYYNNAVVTLAIADALHCDIGLLHRRHHHSPPIPGDDGEFYCLRKVLPEDFHLNVESWISRRAWTLQERILSPRLIHATRDQLLWHCRERDWAEGYIYNSYRRHEECRIDRMGHFIDRAEYDAYWERRHAASGSTSPYEPFFSLDFAAETWYDCVSEFSTRSLTRGSDKLPAIAGLANMFSHPKLGRYMSGLWESDLFRGMTWMRVEPGERTRDRYQSYFAIKAKRNLAARSYKPPVEYRAPSWSWASVNGPVEVNSSMFYFAKRGATEEMQSEVEHWKKQYGPRLVSCNLLHSDGNPYIDTLQGSFIEIHGYYRKLWVSQVKLPREADGPGGPFVKRVLFDKDAPKQFYIHLEEPTELGKAWKELLVLQVSKQCSGDRHVYGLLLEKLQDADSFTRVGLVELACYNLCETPKKRPRGAGFVYYLHPIHSSFSNRKKDYETKEWQRDRWLEGTLKIF